MILVSPLHTANFLSLQHSSATFSSTACMVLSLGDHHAAPLWSQCSAITSSGCQGQRAGSMGLECSRVCVCVCVCVGGWVDGGQSVACLHFIYHSLGAVNLHWCLPMTISLPVGLHLLFALFLSSRPTACVSRYKSPRDALCPVHTTSFSR